MRSGMYRMSRLNSWPFSTYDGFRSSAAMTATVAPVHERARRSAAGEVGPRRRQPLPLLRRHDRRHRRTGRRRQPGDRHRAGAEVPALEGGPALAVDEEVDALGL